MEHLVILELLIATLGFYIGMLVGAGACDSGWRERAIRHNAGRIHPLTKEFEWNNGDKP